MKKMFKFLMLLVIPLMMLTTILETNKGDLITYTNKNKAYSFFVFSVGNGIFSLIKQDANAIVFDCGVGLGSNDKYNEFPIRQIKDLGVKNIQTIFISHYHYDHYSLINKLIQNYNIENICLPVNKNYKNILPYGIKINKLNYQEYYNFMGLKILNLTYYSKDFFATNHKDQNDYSAVYLVSLCNKKILMTFDSLDEELTNNNFLATMKQKMYVDIFMAAHHGSDNSSSNLLSKYFDYKTVIISGTNNYERWKKYSGGHFFPGQNSYNLFKNKKIYLTGDDSRKYECKNSTYEYTIFKDCTTKLYCYNNKIIDY